MSRFSTALFSVAAGLVLLIAGCSEKRIEGLVLEQIPTAIAVAFEKADAGIRMQAEMVAASVKANQFVPAMSAVNDLLGFPSLTPAQRQVLSQAQITIGARMREMAGDALPDAPSANATTPKRRTTSAEPAAPPAPEEAAAAAAALRIYQQSK